MSDSYTFFRLGHPITIVNRAVRDTKGIKIIQQTEVGTKLYAETGEAFDSYEKTYKKHLALHEKILTLYQNIDTKTPAEAIADYREIIMLRREQGDEDFDPSDIEKEIAMIQEHIDRKDRYS